TFEDVYFAFDSAFLNEKSRESVKRLKVFLDEHPNYKITIIGNTDSQGSDAYNQQLAFNRARGIALYLENLGLGNNRLEVKSQGSQYPRATNESTEGRRLNRRVEFVLTQID
ncbi:MAG: OmpA family protein, partial [Flavobacteriaceae bacterium]